MPKRKYTFELSKKEAERLRRAVFAKPKNEKIATDALALLLLDKGDFITGNRNLRRTSRELGLSVRYLNELQKKFIEEGIDSIIGSQTVGNLDLTKIQPPKTKKSTSLSSKSNLSEIKENS